MAGKIAGFVVALLDELGEVESPGCFVERPAVFLSEDADGDFSRVVVGAGERFTCDEAPKVAGAELGRMDVGVLVPEAERGAEDFAQQRAVVDVVGGVDGGQVGAVAIEEFVAVHPAWGELIGFGRGDGGEHGVADYLEPGDVFGADQVLQREGGFVDDARVGRVEQVEENLAMLGLFELGECGNR